MEVRAACGSGLMSGSYIWRGLETGARRVSEGVLNPVLSGLRCLAQLRDQSLAQGQQHVRGHDCPLQISVA
jgi:hypothetical protein